MRAAMSSYMDPTDLINRIDDIDSGLPLETIISEVMDIVQESAARLRTFMMAMKGQHLRAIAAMRADAARGGVRPGAAFWNGLGLRMNGDEDHGSPHQFVSQASSLVAAIERALKEYESDFVVDLPQACTYILTISLASIIVNTAFPTTNGEATTALTIRALTHHRKEPA